REPPAGGRRGAGEARSSRSGRGPTWREMVSSKSAMKLHSPLHRADRRLLQVVDGALAEATRLAATPEGSWLACRPGCTECCHGPFPINRLDVLRLRRGLAERD